MYKDSAIERHLDRITAVQQGQERIVMYKFLEQQKALADKWKMLEQVQTEYSGDQQLFRCIQRGLDALDEQMECIRRLGECS